MRLSVRKSSPFYDAKKLALSPQVFVDGVPITGCFEASEEEGWADRMVRGDDGKFVLNEARDGVAIERIHGQVELRFFALHQ